MTPLDLKSEVTGTVWRVVAHAGQEVAEDDPVLVIESMKMEVPLCAPEDCTVLEVLVAESEMVQEGDVVARLAVA